MTEKLLLRLKKNTRVTEQRIIILALVSKHDYIDYTLYFFFFFDRAGKVSCHTLGEFEPIEVLPEC